MTEIRTPGDENTATLCLLAEYKSLKAEGMEYLKLQNRIVLLLPLLFSAAILLAITDGQGIAALLVFPLLSTLLALAWNQQNYRRLQINSYISDQLEPALNLHWSTHQKLFERARRRRTIPFQPGTRISPSAAALSVQWLFIALDILTVILLIGFILFSAAGKQLSLLSLLLGIVGNILLLLFKYWLIMRNSWESKLALEDPSAITVIKAENKEMYPRCQQAINEAAREVCIPPASQSLNYCNCLYEQLLYVKQGIIELRDGSVSAQQRLENRKQYVKVCEPGDIVRIPAGANYIIANSCADQSAVVKHLRILLPELLIR